jgi:hypothetical protein
MKNNVLETAETWFEFRTLDWSTPTDKNFELVLHYNYDSEFHKFDHSVDIFSFHKENNFPINKRIGCYIPSQFIVDKFL